MIRKHKKHIVNNNRYKINSWIFQNSVCINQKLKLNLFKVNKIKNLWISIYVKKVKKKIMYMII